MKYLKKFKESHRWGDTYDPLDKPFSFVPVSPKFKEGDLVRLIGYNDDLKFEICEVIGDVSGTNGGVDYLLIPTITGGKIWRSDYELEAIPEYELQSIKFNL